VLTDTEGRFRFNPYLRERFDLTVAVRGGQPYLALTRAVNPVKGAVKQTVEIVLPRGVLLDGKVTEKDSGKGVSGAQVFFEQRSKNNPKFRLDLLVGGGFTTRTGGDGSFKLVVPEGPGHLFCRAPGSEFVRKTSEAQMNKGYVGRDRTNVHAIVPMDLSAKDSPKKTTVTLQRGVTLRVRVLGPDGKEVKEAVLFCGNELREPPRMAANLSFALPNEVPFHVLELKDGLFELPGCDPEKTHRVLIVDDSRVPEEMGGPQKIPGMEAGYPFRPEGSGLLRDTPDRVGAAADLSAKQADGKPITVKLQPCGKAQMRFVDGNGKAVRVIPSFEILVAPKNGKMPAEWMRLGGPNRDSPLKLLTPDKEGRLTIGGLIPGATYRIRGYDWRDVARVTFEREFTAESGKTRKLKDIVVETQK
jgi:hypothetical protein